MPDLFKNTDGFMEKEPDWHQKSHILKIAMSIFQK